MKFLVRFIAKHFTRQKDLAQLIRLSNSYLEQMGWNLSVRKGMPVDPAGKPIPWLCYATIDFLAKKLQPTFHVFEYGSGNSTLWLAERVASVTSVEHDQNWYELVQKKVQAILNITLFYGNRAAGDYVEQLAKQEQKFDLIIIDGRDRVACAKNCLGSLSEQGVILFDNTDRENYQEGIDFLIHNGFKKIDFTGIAPVSSIYSQSTIFYRTANVFGI